MNGSNSTLLLQEEIRKVVKKVCNENEDITYATVIGVLELMKVEVIENLKIASDLEVEDELGDFENDLTGGIIN
jgi:hypothetical protein